MDYINSIACYCFVIFLFLLQPSAAQDNNITSDANIVKVDKNSNNKQDTLKIISPSGVDTTITFYAADTVTFNPKNKRMLLKGNAKVDFKTQSLEAAIIEVDFENSLLYANLSKDSTGKIIGVPKFNDNGEEFYSEQLTYNFKTKSGTIKNGETKMGEGFYFGENIQKTSDKELYVTNGYYTTCDAPEPHYHFGSTKMKMIMGEKIFVDPLILYVEDIPIFAIPFGLFLPINRGRCSGLIVPSFYFSKSRGVVFEKLGFYWAISDYLDTKITADIYTKGGALLNTDTRWALKDVMNGSAQISFGKTRFSINDEFSKEWKLVLNHNHVLTPFDNFNVNLNLASQDFNRNTSTNINTRIQQNIHSSAAYSHTFENGISTSLSFQNDQNIITSEYQGSIPLNLSIPQIQMKRIFNIPNNTWYSWMRDITFKYNGNAYYNFDKTQIINSYYDEQNTLVFDTNFTNDARAYISHTPTLSISPKLGYFTITPNIGFSANNYFRKLKKTVNNDTNIIENFQNGFFTEYNYSFGIGVSTRLYGIADSKQKLFWLLSPSTLGLRAIRHTYQPSLNFNYTPDFSLEKYGFYGRYTDSKTRREVVYSYFEKEGGSHASRYLQKRLSYSDIHSFEIKKKGENDTLPDTNIELLRLGLTGSYNFASDSLNFSDISLNLRTPAVKFLDFNSNAIFTLYDEEKVVNPDNNYSYYTKVNKFLISNSKGIARLTNFNMNISTSFSSNGLIGIDEAWSLVENVNKHHENENSGLGTKFIKRNSNDSCEADLFAENSYGYSPIKIPWSITIGLNFNYNNTTVDIINRSLNLNTSLNFTIADSWIFSSSLQYDFINKKIITPQINLRKDLHCWDLTASWYPSGYNQGFYLRFGIKASQLRDLKIEKRDSPIFR